MELLRVEDRRTLRKEIPWRINKLEIENVNQEVVHLKLHIICFAAIAVLSSAVLAAKKPAPKPPVKQSLKKPLKKPVRKPTKRPAQMPVKKPAKEPAQKPKACPT